MVPFLGLPSCEQHSACRALAVWGARPAVWGACLAVWGARLAVWGARLAVWRGASMADSFAFLPFLPFS